MLATPPTDVCVTFGNLEIHSHRKPGSSVSNFFSLPTTPLCVCVCSLLSSRVDHKDGEWAFVPVAIGFALGAAFVYGADILIQQLVRSMHLEALLRAPFLSSRGVPSLILSLSLACARARCRRETYSCRFSLPCTFLGVLSAWVGHWLQWLGKWCEHLQQQQGFVDGIDFVKALDVKKTDGDTGEEKDTSASTGTGRVLRSRTTKKAEAEGDALSAEDAAANKVRVRSSHAKNKNPIQPCVFPSRLRYTVRTL